MECCIQHVIAHMPSTHQTHMSTHMSPNMKQAVEYNFLNPQKEETGEEIIWAGLP